MLDAKIPALRTITLALLYGLTLAAAAAAQEVEPNHPCPAAQDMGALGSPISLTGSLDTPPEVPDIDFYRFTATPGDQIIVDLEGDSTGQGTLHDPLLGVFDLDCLYPFDSDDDGGEYLNSRLTFTVPASGGFVIAATSYGDFGFTGDGYYAGSYSLSLQRLALAQAVFGRAVDAQTSFPLYSAAVDLLRCVDGICGETVGFVYTAGAGAFRFDSSTVYSPLRTGDYKIVIRAENYQPTEIAISLTEGQELDLGDVLVTPTPVINSIRGRAVDELTGQPLSGVAEPFASAELLFCEADYYYCYGIRHESMDAQGNFRFDGTSYSPLFPGTYQVRIYAHQYRPTESERFAVAAGEDFDVGDIRVKSYPVRIYLAETCGAIPASGGNCRFTVRVINGMAGRLQGEAWNLVSAYGDAGTTTFQTGQPKALSLAAGESVTLPFTFFIPGTVSNGTFICASTLVAQRPSSFSTLGVDHPLCLVKGYGGFSTVPEQQKREAVRISRGEVTTRGDHR